MKTPEEIKKGLECCYSPVEPMLRCEACPYCGSIVCKMRLHTDALTFIQQLEQIALHWQSSMDQVQKALQDNGFQTLEELLQSYSQVKWERDAAIRDCARFPCYTCNERENGDFCPQCRTMGTFRTLHEWRGPCEENGGLPEEVPEKEEEHEADSD